MVLSREYKQLYEATRNRAHPPKQVRYKLELEQLHDYMLFGVNSGLTRPDVFNFVMSRSFKAEVFAKTILEIELGGKPGLGYCKSVAGVVRPFERLKGAASSDPTCMGTRG